MVPSIHRVDCFADILATLLFDAACIDPEEMDAVSQSLLSAKAYFAITGSLASCAALLDILERDLILVSTPRMRQNGVWRNVVSEIFDKAEIAIAVDLKKTHLDKVVDERGLTCRSKDGVAKRCLSASVV